MGILASNFSGIGPFLCVGVCLILLACFSYIGSSYGHWSGPAMASPLLLGLLAWIGVALRDAADPAGLAWMMIILSPLLLLGGGSILLWRIRRKPS